ncbi:MAG: hypothetical protein WC346_03255 [Methanogenium sp.]|jgi:hypothetical protein
MISLKLIKRLKKVGFPEKYCKHFYITDKKGKNIGIPSLEELIKACGKDFESLVLVSDIQNKKRVYWWQAYMTEKAFDKLGIPCVRDCCGYDAADEPDEAVAELYISLNKKPTCGK